jgi:small-conductance mechanosensitive channel
MCWALQMFYKNEKNRISLFSFYVVVRLFSTLFFVLFYNDDLAHPPSSMDLIFEGWKKVKFIDFLSSYSLRFFFCFSSFHFFSFQFYLYAEAVFRKVDIIIISKVIFYKSNFICHWENCLCTNLYFSISNEKKYLAFVWLFFRYICRYLCCVVASITFLFWRERESLFFDMRTVK